MATVRWACTMATLTRCVNGPLCSGYCCCCPLRTIHSKFKLCSCSRFLLLLSQEIKPEKFLRGGKLPPPPMVAPLEVDDTRRRVMIFGIDPEVMKRLVFMSKENEKFLRKLAR